jgi:alcohol dehydrogenase YqhD (iron-dependent ADH family)
MIPTFRFYNPVKIIAGEGAIESLGPELKNWAPSAR